MLRYAAGVVGEEREESGDAYLTLTSDAAAEAAEILAARDVVPLHFEHWTHFTQGAETLVDSFRRAGLGKRLHLLEPGRRVELPVDQS